MPSGHRTALGDVVLQTTIKALVIRSRVIPRIVLRHASALHPLPGVTIVIERNRIANALRQRVTRGLIKQEAGRAIRVERLGRHIDHRIGKTANAANQGQRRGNGAAG